MMKQTVLQIAAHLNPDQDKSTLEKLQEYFPEISSNAESLRLR
jgi:hypothetical protein